MNKADMIKMAKEEQAVIDEIKARIESVITKDDAMTDIVYALVECAKDITRGNEHSRSFFSEAVNEIDVFYLEETE